MSRQSTFSSNDAHHGRKSSRRSAAVSGDGGFLSNQQQFSKIFDEIIHNFSCIRSLPQSAIQEILKSVRLNKSLGESIIRTTQLKNANQDSKMVQLSKPSKLKCRNFWSSFESNISTFSGEIKAQEQRLKSMISRAFSSTKNSMNTAIQVVAQQAIAQTTKKGKQKILIESNDQIQFEQIAKLMNHLLDEMEESESDVECYFDTPYKELRFTQEEEEDGVSADDDGTSEDFSRIYNSLKFMEERILDVFRTPSLLVKENKSIASDVSLGLSKIIQVFCDFHDLQNSNKSIRLVFESSMFEIKRIIPKEMTISNDMKLLPSPQNNSNKTKQKEASKIPKKQLKMQQQSPISNNIRKPRTKSNEQLDQSNSDDPDTNEMLRKRVEMSRESVQALKEEIQRSNQTLREENESLERQKNNLKEKRRICKTTATQNELVKKEIALLENEKNSLITRIQSLKSTIEKLQEKENQPKKAPRSPHAMPGNDEFELIVEDNDSLLENLRFQKEELSKQIEEQIEMNLIIDQLLKSNNIHKNAKILKKNSPSLPEYKTNGNYQIKLQTLENETYQKEKEYLMLCCIRDKMNHFIPSRSISGTSSTQARLSELKTEYEYYQKEYDRLIQNKKKAIESRCLLRQKPDSKEDLLLQELGQARSSFEQIASETVPQCNETEMRQWQQSKARFESRLYRLRHITKNSIDELNNDSEQENEEQITEIIQNEAREESKMIGKEILRMKKRYISVCQWRSDLNDTDIREEARGMSLKIQYDALQAKLKDPSFDENACISQMIEQLSSEVSLVSKKLRFVNSSFLQLSSLINS